jgi:hypothetical protein
MDRRTSPWWLIVLWIPAIALVLGVLLGCASGSARPPLAQPTRAELHRLIAAELAADSRFDSFGAAHNPAAHRMAASFRPVLADVLAIECRAADGASLDCTLEVVLHFPELDGRETRTVWERRLRQVAEGWRIVGAAPH